jgi:dCMP deaminase
VPIPIRRTKASVFMEMAHVLRNLGTCDRKQVGALIVRDGRCISWGYNGAPPGLPHCDENYHGWSNEPEAGAALSVLGCRNATHAEANALAFAARQGISTEGAELFVTVSPCETCARLIIAAGIIHVYYSEEYRKDDGVRLLQQASIESVRL